MFPLLDAGGPNPLELFQIWLNLPARDKLAAPYFTMFWERELPRRRFTDAGGRSTAVTLTAGALDDLQPLAPPPNSWAAREEADVAIWSIALEAGAAWTVPAAHGHGTARTLHVFAGSALKVEGRVVPCPAAIQVHAQQAVSIEAVDGRVEILLLQGRPIGEPVAQHGPFVMNTRSELEQAFADYRRTRFGGWPWPSDAPVHPRGQGRFARHADGRLEVGSLKSEV
jgi:redox-sensitive bicupin YhaK (pirin superfamily)